MRKPKEKPRPAGRVYDVAGRCAICGEADERTVFGERYCRQCAEDGGAAFFASLGSCTMCGKPLDRRGYLCTACVSSLRLEYGRQKVARYKERKKEREATGYDTGNSSAS